MNLQDIILEKLQEDSRRKILQHSKLVIKKKDAIQFKILHYMMVLYCILLLKDLEIVFNLFTFYLK